MKMITDDSNTLVQVAKFQDQIIQTGPDNHPIVPSKSDTEC